MFLSRWLRSPARHTPAARPRFRPGVEGLEAREVPAILTVTTTADVIDPNDGVLSLREAVSQANSSPGTDAIVLPAGTFALSRAGIDEDAALTGDLDLAGHLTITGAGAASTVIDGGNIDRVLEVLPDATVGLSGVTILHGGNNFTTVSGGGIANHGSLTIRDCALSGNEALAGGALFNGTSYYDEHASPATLTLIATTVTGNSGFFGGSGIWNSGILVCKECSISDNSGGAIYSGYGSITLRDCSFINNFAGSFGAVFNAGGTATIVGCTFADNSSDSVGSIDNLGTMSIEACTITRNQAGTYGVGGGVANGGQLTIKNSVISDNSAGWAGGGILNLGDATFVGCVITGNATSIGDGGGIFNGLGALTVRDTTLTGNSAVLGGGIFNDIGSVLLVDSTVTGNSASTAGGGVYNGANPWWGRSGSLTVRGSTVVANIAPLGGDLFNLGTVFLYDSTVGDRYDG